VTDTGAAATLNAGDDDASTTFSGLLQNGTSALALTKSGTGTLTLTGTNLYTGATTIVPASWNWAMGAAPAALPATSLITESESSIGPMRV
jgi:autotransporter-associated beta strand protein